MMPYEHEISSSSPFGERRGTGATAWRDLDERSIDVPLAFLRRISKESSVTELEEHECCGSQPRLIILARTRALYIKSSISLSACLHFDQERIEEDQEALCLSGYCGREIIPGSGCGCRRLSKNEATSKV